MDLPETQVKQEMKFNFTIPENAAFHIEVSDGTTDANGELICETDIESNLYEHIVRKDYYYDTHADNIPNADIFEAAMKVSLSMSSYNDGQAALMLTLKDMNKFTNLELDYDVWDLPAKRSDRGLGVRVDYHTESGYTSQKYYYYDDYSNCFYYNYNKANANGYTWGNGQDITSGGVSIGSGTNGTFTIPLKANAPSGWDGRVQLTYFMINGGQNANAIFTTRGV